MGLSMQSGQLRDQRQSLSAAENWLLQLPKRVSDDEELDRVGDVDLVGSGGAARGPGWPIAVRSMKGRSRSYNIGAPSAKSVLSIAFNSRCDVTFATVVADGDPVAQEQAVLEFLNSDLVMRRIEEVLGL